MGLKVTDYDDRGGQGPEGVMFGFVYFSDDTRVAYATGHGVTDGTGGWPEITPRHQELATQHLNEKAPGWNGQPQT